MGEPPMPVDSEMRWLTYFILAYVALGVQIGTSGYLRYQGAGPNFVLLAAIFIAINAPRDSALLGCFVLGAMQDLVTQQSLGLYAFSYGLVAMFVVSTQSLVYRAHPLTHFSLALVGGLMTMAVLAVHGWVHPPGAAVERPGLPAVAASRVGVMTLFVTVLYTAVLSPIVLGLLERTRRAFGFEPARRKVRAVA